MDKEQFTITTHVCLWRNPAGIAFSVIWCSVLVMIVPPPYSFSTPADRVASVVVIVSILTGPLFGLGPSLFWHTHRVCAGGIASTFTVLGIPVRYRKIKQDEVDSIQEHVARGGRTQRCYLVLRGSCVNARLFCGHDIDMLRTYCRDVARLLRLPEPSGWMSSRGSTSPGTLRRAHPAKRGGQASD